MKKSGSIWVVFDSSAQYDAMSLNDVLLTGPDLNNSLGSPLDPKEKPSLWQRILNRCFTTSLSGNKIVTSYASFRSEIMILPRMLSSITWLCMSLGRVPVQQLPSTASDSLWGEENHTVTLRWGSLSAMTSMSVMSWSHSPLLQVRSVCYPEDPGHSRKLQPEGAQNCL